MSHSPDPHATEDNVAEVQTPKATTSNFVLICIGVLILTVSLISVKIFDAKETEVAPDLATSVAKPDFDATFNMLDMPIGSIQQIILPAQTSAKVELLNYGHFPMWSSDHIEVYDDKKQKRVVGRDSKGRLTFLQGDYKANEIKFIILKNNKQYSDTVRIGHCISETDCNIKF